MVVNWAVLTTKVDSHVKDRRLWTVDVGPNSAFWPQKSTYLKFTFSNIFHNIYKTLDPDINSS